MAVFVDMSTFRSQQVAYLLGMHTSLLRAVTDDHIRLKLDSQCVSLQICASSLFMIGITKFQMIEHENLSIDATPD